MIDFDCYGTGKRKADENAPERQQLKKARPASGKNKAPQTDLLKHVMIEAKITNLIV